MNSALFVGKVMHRRHAPFDHRFVRRLYMTWLDLDELDTAFAGRWLWSSRRFAWSRFRREDHLGDPAVPLADCVRQLVEDEIGRRPDGPVRLLTNLRVAGMRMNPVSFHFCYAADGETLEAMVAEVTNTPWGERHCYVLDLANAGREHGVIRVRHPKDFHVSPFMPLERDYVWWIAEPGERLALLIESIDHDERLTFDAGLSMRRVELTGRSMAAALIGLPFMTLSIAVGIYWHALRLKLRGARFFPHPGKRDVLGIAS